MTRAIICMVATACALTLLLAYKGPSLPLAPPVDRAAASAPPGPGGRGPEDGGELEVVGPPAGWVYGRVQVRVTLAGGRITDVSVADMATTNPVSRFRSRAAVSQLRGEVLSSQGHGVDVVTGATYTSNAYLHSLQAALDMAHAATVAR